MLANPVTAEVLSLALETFLTQESAGEWLDKPHPLLGGAVPRDAALSTFGAKRVKELLYDMKELGGI